MSQHETFEYVGGFLVGEDRVRGASYSTEGVLENIYENELGDNPDVTALRIGGDSPLVITILNTGPQSLEYRLTHHRPEGQQGSLNYSFDEDLYGEIIGSDWRDIPGETVFQRFRQNLEYTDDPTEENFRKNHSGNCQVVSEFFYQLMDSRGEDRILREGRVWTDFDNFLNGPKEGDTIETASHRWVEKPDGKVQDPTLALRKLEPEETVDLPRSNYFFNLPILRVNGESLDLEERRLKDH